MASIELWIVDLDRTLSDRAEVTRDLLSLLGGEGYVAEAGRQQQDALAGARGTEALELGLVLVQAAADAGLLARLFGLVGRWRGEAEVGEVEIVAGGKRLRVSAATAEQQQQLIEHFIAISRDAD